MKKFEQISYAKTVYGQEEVDAVIKCLSESTQIKLITILHFKLLMH